MEPDNQIKYLDGLASGYQKSQVLFTALRNGIFELLKEPRDAATVADAQRANGRLAFARKG